MSWPAATILAVALAVAAIGVVVAWLLARKARPVGGALAAVVLGVLVAAGTWLLFSGRHFEECTIVSPEPARVGFGPLGPSLEIRTRECGTIYESIDDEAAARLLQYGHTYRLTFVGRGFLRHYEGVEGEVRR